MVQAGPAKPRQRAYTSGGAQDSSDLFRLNTRTMLLLIHEMCAPEPGTQTYLCQSLQRKVCGADACDCGWALDTSQQIFLRAQMSNAYEKEAAKFTVLS